jgi:hypothetical protein
VVQLRVKKNHHLENLERMGLRTAMSQVVQSSTLRKWKKDTSTTWMMKSMKSTESKSTKLL